MRISSAASRNDGITFFGSKYKLEMNETKDGTFEYKHKELPKLEQAMDEKINSIFLIGGIYQFFKMKFLGFLWLAQVFLIIVTSSEKAKESMIFLGISLAITFLMIASLVFMVSKMYGTMKRVALYHGAEHKVIHAFQKKVELTLENVREQPRYHNSCGSMLACFLITVAIIFRIFVQNVFLFFPLIFAISLEIFRVKNAETLPVLKWFYKFGQIIQEKFLTKEPTDEMILASIEAVNQLIELEEK